MWYFTICTILIFTVSVNCAANYCDKNCMDFLLSSNYSECRAAQRNGCRGGILEEDEPQPYDRAFPALDGALFLIFVIAVVCIACIAWFGCLRLCFGDEVGAQPQLPRHHHGLHRSESRQPLVVVSSNRLEPNWSPSFPNAVPQIPDYAIPQMPDDAT